jgi:hypothetical protein
MRHLFSGATWIVGAAGAAVAAAHAIAACNHEPTHSYGALEPVAGSDMSAFTELVTELPEMASIDYVTVRRRRTMPRPYSLAFTMNIARDRADTTRLITLAAGPLGVVSLATRTTASGRPASEGGSDEAPLHDVLGALLPPGTTTLTPSLRWDDDPPGQAARDSWDAEGAWVIGEEQSFHIDRAWHDGAGDYTIVRVASTIYRSTVETKASRDASELRKQLLEGAYPVGRQQVTGAALTDIVVPGPKAHLRGSVVLRSVALYLSQPREVDQTVTFEEVAADPDALSVALCPAGSIEDVPLSMPSPSPAAFIAGCSSN